jgi:hypothetical protein
LKTLRAVWGVAKADFRERVRKFSFLAFCALAIFLTFWFIPRSTGFTALSIDPSVFLQGSDPSWVPMSSAMCGSMLLSLFGFAYVKNAVRRDRETGVLSLLRTSPTKRAAYLFGKLISSTLTLFCLLAVTMAGSFLVMEIRFPGRFLSPWDFFTPFLCVMPGLVFVSAFALLMECAPLFRQRGGLAIALFVCLDITSISLSASAATGDISGAGSRFASVFDFNGYLWMIESISAAARSVTGEPLTQISVFSDYHVKGTHLKPLVFHGLIPSDSYLTDKLILIAVSLLITILAAALLPKTEKAISLSKPAPVPSRTKIPSRAAVPVYRFGLFHSELHMMLATQSVFWWLCAADLWIACLFSPMKIVRNTFAALVFAWLVPVFSRMGCLEHQSGMTAVLRTIPGAMPRQALSCWGAGVSISLTAMLPVLARTLCTADWAGLLSAFIFALFVPSLALFLGEWTKSNRAFEILLLILCFLALNVQGLLVVDQFSVSSGLRMTVTILLTGVMLFLSLCKRLASQKACT